MGKACRCITVGIISVLAPAASSRDKSSVESNLPVDYTLDPCSAKGAQY